LTFDIALLSHSSPNWVFWIHIVW